MVRACTPGRTPGPGGVAPGLWAGGTSRGVASAGTTERPTGAGVWEATESALARGAPARLNTCVAPCVTGVSLRALSPTAVTRRPTAGEGVSRIGAAARPEPGMLETGCCTTPARALAACDAVREAERLKGATAVPGAATAFRADRAGATMVPAASWPTAAAACPAALAGL